MKRILHTLSQKWPEYLLEILVLIIGIYGAFSLDNWNEGRKNNLLEKEILTEIQASLIKTQSDLDFNIEHRNKSLKSQDLIIDWMSSTQPYHDSLDRHFALAHIYTYLLVHSSGFESLKKAGVRLISNDSLRDQITTLFQENLYGTEQLDRNYRSQIEYLQNFLNVKYFEVTRPFDVNQADLIGEMKPKNIDLLKSDPEPIYQMKTLRNNNELNIVLFMLPLRATIAKIIDEIELELEK